MNRSEFVKSWVNEYGYDEGYVYRDISKSYTGHLYRGSAMETDSSCGNCDGARCDTCKPIWTVTRYDPPHKEYVPEYDDEFWCDTMVEKKIFCNQEDAKNFYNSLK